MFRTRVTASAVLAVCALAVVLPSMVPAQAAMSTVPTHGHKIEYPTVEEGSKRREARGAVGTPTGSGKLAYRGAVDGIGVTTGAPRVYVVFWGSQWGAPTTVGANLTFAGDTKGMAPRVQDLLRGIGTNNELWSGVLTQYCEGVAVGATACPSTAPHVGYPSGGALAGVWYDSATAVPATTNDNQIATEAVNAATHFGNTTPAANRNAQYVIVSPTGTHPGGFNTTSANWCAWHDWNGDTTLVGGAAASTVGDVAFTNLPYIPDMGASCGAGYVNAGNALDGVTIVEGHEYAETVTDQNPAGGWTDAVGYENGDKCAWVGVGGTGGAQNIAFATGSFAMQATYSNDSSSCLVSHPIVSTVTLTDDFSITAAPTALTLPQGSSSAVTITTVTTLGAGQNVTLSASGLPAGVTASFNPAVVASGQTSTLTLTSTAYATPGAVTVAITGAEAAVSHTASVAVTVAGIVNGGFETGSTTGWTATGTKSITSTGAYQGASAAVLGSTAPTRTSSLAQTFTAPAGKTALSLAYQNVCADVVANDYATVTLKDNTTAATVTVVPRTCTKGAAWQTVSTSVVAGHSYTLTLTNVDNGKTGTASYTRYDAVAFN